MAPTMFFIKVLVAPRPRPPGRIRMSMSGKVIGSLQPPLDNAVVFMKFVSLPVRAS